MIDMSHLYQTRDGRAVEILAVGLYCDSPFNVVGIIWRGDGKCIVEAWTPEGKTTHDSIVYNNDLVPVPTKHEGWCLVRGSGQDMMCQGPIYATREAALQEMKVGPNVFVYYQLAHVTWET